MPLDLKILIRGGGEMATGVAHRLARAHFKVCITEIPQPLAVRREVSFSEAIYEGEKEVEGIIARYVDSLEKIFQEWEREAIPVLIDPVASIKADLKPDVLIDAILAKKNLGTHLSDAPLVIGLGPGFRAGEDVHMVVETNRGHHLGRLILKGCAEADTGVPGVIGGYTSERVLRAPGPGRTLHMRKIGDRVKAGETVLYVGQTPVKAQIPGVLRGLIREGIQVPQGIKVGDIDPRGILEHCYTISEKARAIAGGVLEGILMVFNGTS
ncbi:MAG TPA: selenium-dependent molybdenum cofactor biosynthesis protein YqeB [Candidatus Limnocylindrales bacterium]|nr:selenium-dependent molybdenum cofactor biosynthesis protein YqeB [Candidatus Limnocylindrales bacterium]